MLSIYTNCLTKDVVKYKSFGLNRIFLLYFNSGYQGKRGKVPPGATPLLLNWLKTIAAAKSQFKKRAH